MSDGSNDFDDDTPARIEALETLLAQLMATLVNEGTLSGGDIVQPAKRAREDLRKPDRDTGKPDPERVAVAEAMDTIMFMFNDLRKT